MAWVGEVAGILIIKKSINSIEPSKLFEKLSVARLKDYETKPTYYKFGHVWSNRVYELANKFGVEIKKKRLS